MRVPFERQPLGKFAVMRHSDKAKRMHFSMMHDTYEAARDEAQRLTAEGIAEHGPGRVGYYVLHVCGRVGVFDGVLEDGSRK